MNLYCGYCEVGLCCRGVCVLYDIMSVVEEKSRGRERGMLSGVPSVVGVRACVLRTSL